MVESPRRVDGLRLEEAIQPPIDRQQRDIEDAQARWQDYKDRKKGNAKMALTRSFKETVQARVQCDPAFREELLAEGGDAFLAGDIETGKVILRDFINATIGLWARMG
jgi:hypothetical protein